MENEDDESVSHSPISDLLSNKTLAILSATSLGLGLGFLYTRSPQNVKPISTAIKVSEAALKGSKSLTRISSPADLLFFSKYLMKISFAASTHFNCSPSLDVKKIKAYLGAVNLVRYMSFLPVVGIGVFDLGVLKIGYKLSKNFMKVLEGFLGIQLDSAVRNCVEVVELFVKTATVTREVSRIADSKGWKERLKLGEIDGDCSDVAENSTCRFVRSLDFDSGDSYGKNAHDDAFGEMLKQNSSSQFAWIEVGYLCRNLIDAWKLQKSSSCHCACCEAV